MNDDEIHTKEVFEVGDIVKESSLIVPFDRKQWTGIVVYVKKDFYDLHYQSTFLEDMVGVHWLQPGYVETLPGSVIVLVRRAKEKKNKT